MSEKNRSNGHPNLTVQIVDSLFTFTCVHTNILVVFRAMGLSIPDLSTKEHPRSNFTLRLLVFQLLKFGLLPFDSSDQANRLINTQTLE